MKKVKMKEQEEGKIKTSSSEWCGETITGLSDDLIDFNTKSRTQEVHLT